MPGPAASAAALSGPPAGVWIAGTVGGAVALLAAAGLTGVVRSAAPRLGVVDAPDGVRKRHRKPTPLWGGVAVTLAFVLGAGVLLALLPITPPGAPVADVPAGTGLWGLLLSAAGFCLVGAYDDAKPLRARGKLAGMGLAAVPFAVLGPGVRVLGVPGGDWVPGWEAAAVELGPLGPVFAAAWVVGWANVINLTDGLDGLASGVGLIVAASLCGHAALVGLPGVAALSAVFAAAVFGFLPHNLPTRRAKIFLGDSGSLPVGATLGMLSLWTASKGATGATAAGLLLGATAAGAVSGFDVLAAVVRRRLTGKSMAHADRHHLHHRLRDRGWTPGRVLAAILTMTAATAAAGLLGSAFDRPWLAPAACGALFVTLAAARVFGHHEAALVGAAVKRRLPAGGVPALRVVRPPKPAPNTAPALPAAAEVPRRKAA